MALHSRRSRDGLAAWASLASVGGRADFSRPGGTSFRPPAGGCTRCTPAREERRICQNQGSADAFCEVTYLGCREGRCVPVRIPMPPQACSNCPGSIVTPEL